MYSIPETSCTVQVHPAVDAANHCILGADAAVWQFVRVFVIIIIIVIIVAVAHGLFINNRQTSHDNINGDSKPRWG